MLAQNRPYEIIVSDLSYIIRGVRKLVVRAVHHKTFFFNLSFRFRVNRVKSYLKKKKKSVTTRLLPAVNCLLKCDKM